MTAHGQVLRRTGDGGTEPAPYPSVDLQFSSDGKTWTTKNRLLCEENGAFTLTAKATQDGYWRAAVEDDGTYLPAISGSDYGRATYDGTSTYLAVTGSGDYVDVS